MRIHRKSGIKKAMLVGSTSLLVMAISNIAMAQGVVSNTSQSTSDPKTDDTQTIPDIVVTASKRSERSQDVPISITAVSGAELSSRGVLDAVTLTKTVPGLNVSITSGYGGKLNYTLRGVGLNTYSEVQEAAVAVYQDEVYIASPIGAQFSLFDLDRVEVLRGPQGTLFGRSASGGLISYISKSPGKGAAGYLTAGVGSYGERIVEAAQDVPLDSAGNYAFRASFNYRGSDGFLHNELGGKNLEGGDMYAGRGQLRLEPASNIRILFKGEYGEFDSDHAAGYKHINSYVDSQGISRLVGPDQNIYGTPGGDLFGYRDTSSDYFSTQSFSSPSITYNKRTLLNNKIDWDIGGVTLTSVTGYVNYRENYLEDTSSEPINFVTYGIKNRSEQFQQEIRLSSNPSSRVRWTVGAFYFNYKVHYDTTAAFPTGAAPFGITTPFSAESIADQSRHSFAGYGQVEVPLASKLSFTIGGRAEREYADFTYHQVFSPLELTTAVVGVPPVDFSPSINGDLATIRKTYYSGGATINYHPEDHILLYTSLKRGIKPGGFSTPIAGIAPDKMKFNEEKLDALEGGIKSDWLDGKLRINASAFHYWYNGYQAVQYKDTQTYTGNADARLNGIDAEIVWAPNRSVEIGSSGGYVDATAKSIPLAGDSGTLIRDRTLPNAPKLSVNGYIHYSTNLAGGELGLRFDEVYRSKTYFEIQNNPALVQGAYHTEDLSGNWKKDDWSISIVVSNVLNHKYIAYVQDDSSYGFIDATPAKPRWFTLQVTKTW